MRKKPREEAEESLNKIFEVIQDHLTSLPEQEATERLKSIDGANAIARASQARTSAQPSKTRSSRSYSGASAAECRNAQ